MKGKKKIVVKRKKHAWRSVQIRIGVIEQIREILHADRTITSVTQFVDLAVRNKLGEQEPRARGYDINGRRIKQ